MKVEAFFLDFPGFLGKILGISWIFLDFLTRFLAFLGFLTRFLVFPEKFFILKTLFVRFFSRKNWAFFLKFLTRSCKFVHILGALGKNLVKILTKAFRKLQDSWQEFQDFFHWDIKDSIKLNPMG